MIARGQAASPITGLATTRGHSSLRLPGATVDRSGMRQAILGVTDRVPVAPELGSITAPTLVVVGADDVATPVHKSEAIVAGIAGARLEVVPDCGHSSTIEQPTILSRLLADFIG